MGGRDLQAFLQEVVVAQIMVQTFKDGTLLMWEVQLLYLIPSITVILSDKLWKDTTQLIKSRTYQPAK